jgi:hypothetical protein
MRNVGIGKIHEYGKKLEKIRGPYFFLCEMELLYFIMTSDGTLHS